MTGGRIDANRHIRRGLSRGECILLLAVFSICLAGALLLPVNKCPDEESRLLISDWIFENRMLPTGNEMGTMQVEWGFSYALRPYLSALIGALFKGIVSVFTNFPGVLLAASRMCGVISVTACCFFTLKAGHRLFERRASAVLFAVFVCFTPQVMFLGMYQNNDSLTIAAVSMMIFFMTEGHETHWSLKSCLGLAAGFSVALLSYYTVFGWLVGCAAFCVISVLRDGNTDHKAGFILKRAFLLFMVCLAFAGWFYIRNAMLHDGDALGMAEELRSREIMRQAGYKLYDYVIPRDRGLSPVAFFADGGFYWFRITLESLIGMFGYMDIIMPGKLYLMYAAVMLAGIILFAAALIRGRVKTREKLLFGTMVFSSAVTFLLHFLHSYLRDFQPQGRYVITLLFPLGFMLAGALEYLGTVGNDDKRTAVYHIMTPAAMILWLVLFALSVPTMRRML